ncbi:MAG: histone-lysine N-methyltransferase [Candidatus Omnitrophica bacterium]|nr:histone-lysine N-methyltransferase [Candidatus Omnitrophota bacterium]
MSLKKFPLIEVQEPNLFRDIFPYTEVPRITFDHKDVPMDLPEDFWITCTTFRDGQQSRPPYTVKQIVDLYTFLHRLGGPKGIIRQCEYFLYSKKDREAVEKCLARGYEFPEVTGWIRANKNDFQLVKAMGLKETGILTSCSDYHIFLKLNKNRKTAMEGYLDVVRAALENGVRLRCHLEDVTRADIYGFVLPFVQELMGLSAESGIPIKIRLCDTMGYGVSYPGATLPRSIPRLVHTLIHEGGVPKDLLEWHGHNDFHKVHINAATAWLYGCAAANGTLLGFGERTGNPPIEGLVFEYMALKGSTDGMDTTVITEIADYFHKEMGIVIPPNYPFVGSAFNTTQAGIHADGVFKNEEIYNIFDTSTLLNRPLRVTVTDKSGLAGVAFWVDTFLNLPSDRKVDKQHPGIVAIAKWVEEQYRNLRTTGISDEEMLTLARKYLPQYFESDLDRIKKKAEELMVDLIKGIVNDERVISMDPVAVEPFLIEVVQGNPYIQFIYIVDTNGAKITKNITQKEDLEKFVTKGLDSNFSKRPWFIGPLTSGNVFVTKLYTSKITDKLCITVSAPIRDKESKIVGILGIDLKFEELVKV